MRGQKGIDIAVGRDGSVWLVGQDSRPTGHSIYRWVGKNKWQKITGQAVRIAVGPTGVLWVANSLGDIYKGDASGWGQVRGQKATDIAVGGDGSVWLVGQDSRPDGHSIYRWVGKNKWQKITGQATAISVDAKGAPWVLNSLGDIYRYCK